MTAGQHEGLPEAEGAEDRCHRVLREGATTTGTIWRYINDQECVPIRISAMFVPWLGRNLFSVKAMKSGISALLDIELGFSLPLKLSIDSDCFD